MAKTSVLLLRLLASVAVAGDRGVSGGQPGDGDAEGAATDVVETDFVAEVDALGVAAVLAADAALDAGAASYAVALSILVLFARPRTPLLPTGLVFHQSYPDR